MLQAHDRARLKRLAELFDAVLDLDEGAREKWLAQHCEDAGLRKEVMELCRADSEPQGLLDAPMGLLAGALVEQASDRASAMLGTRIGAWRITALLGEGGMATVWLGERCDGRFEQQVAIKCLRVSLAGPELERRFARERQILADLEHPGIARLLDGGVSDDGVPYIVMERVRGEALIKACDERGLDVRQRLRLFADICDIVQYAHQHLVVHRDLKPGNILIDEEGRPRLLDFGIAGLLGEASGEGMATRALAMTPEYAAPEQRQGRPVGVAADVHALGVILCELLSDGQRPAIADDGDPTERPGQWPSRRVLAGNRHDAAWLRQRARQLRGDLDAIVLQCLRHKPELRYASVAHLAWDVRNYLMHRPVSARRARPGYRASLFVRRHSAGLAAACLVLAVLLAALGLSIHQTRQTEAALDESRAVQGFLVDLFESNLPAGAASSLPSTRELLDRGAQRAREGFAGEPGLRTRMLATIGGIYRRLGQYGAARKVLAEAAATAEDARIGDSDAALDTRREIALLKGDQGQLAEAANMLETVLVERRRQGVRGKELATALRELGRVRSRLGEHARAIALQTEAVAELQGLGSNALQELADTRNDLGAALVRAGDYTAAIAVLRSALADKRRVYGPVHEQVNITASNLAAALRQEEHYEEAGRLLREVVATDQRIYTAPHPEAARHLNNLGTLLDFAGDPLQAREYLLRAHEMYQGLFGRDHPQTAIALSNLAGVEYRLGHAAIAEAMQRQVLRQFLVSYGAHHYSVAVAQNNLARTLADLGKLQEARQLAETSLTLKQDLRGSGDRSTAPALAALARIDRLEGHLESARQRLQQVLALEGMDERSASPSVLGYRTDLAQVLCLQGNAREATETLDAVLASTAMAPAKAPLQRAQTLSVQGDCLALQGNADAARTAWRRALQLRKERLPHDFPDSRRIREKLNEA